MPNEPFYRKKSFSLILNSIYLSSISYPINEMFFMYVYMYTVPTSIHVLYIGTLFWVGVELEFRIKRFFYCKFVLVGTSNRSTFHFPSNFLRHKRLLPKLERN